METMIVVVLIFGLLVSIHEFGHLVVAKKAGILCREFAIGFGPKIFAVRKGETVYTLRLLPIGGYVRMAGEDPEIIEIKPGQSVGLFFNDRQQVRRIVTNHLEKYPDARFLTVEQCDLEKALKISGYEEEDGPIVHYDIDREASYVVDEQDYQIAPLDRQFASQSLPARFLTIFAGPFMNLLLAVVIFIIYFNIQGVPSDAPRFGEMIEGYPAQQAGLKPNDQVLEINGEKMMSWNEITAYISDHPNEKMTFTVERAGNEHRIDVVSREQKEENGVRGIIGVYGPTYHSIWASFKEGVDQTFYWINMELQALKMMVSGEFNLNQLAGPVGIYKATDQVVAHGVILVLNWTAFLSVNLAVINLLPLPALDGGRLMFLIAEALRGKPVEPQKEAFVHFVGFALLMLLMLLVTWNDIQNLFLR
ncbi:RIP metalloprotease RseP [Sporolactobacillus sp. THM7-7]|nr:RIP metalloprotease RseP [Sporolactobacillus sp. THM7-7]